MKNSPTLCQKFVDQAVQNVRRKYKDLYLIHCMDDILAAQKDRALLQQILSELIEALENWGLKIAPEKIQVNPPFSYLGKVLNTHTAAPLQLQRDRLLTLNDFQKLLGDINWIRPHLKLTSADLKPLFDCLKGDPNPSSKRELTSEAELALVKVDEALNDQLIRVNITRGWDLIILTTEHTPTGCLWQETPLEWLHLPVTPRKIVLSYPSLVAQLIIKRRKRSVELFGKEVANIVISFNKDQLQFLLQNSDDWQVALIDSWGQILFHLPLSPLLHFLKTHPVIFPKKFSIQPLEGAISFHRWFL